MSETYQRAEAAFERWWSTSPVAPYHDKESAKAGYLAGALFGLDRGEQAMREALASIAPTPKVA